MRGQALRDEFGLQSNHPIENRELRNHFEHFDERLDDWAEKSKSRGMATIIGPNRTAGIEDSDIIHHYDPATKIYSFRGKPFDVQKLVDGVDDIYQKTCKFLEKT
jgi:hypothetical protein